MPFTSSTKLINASPPVTSTRDALVMQLKVIFVVPQPYPLFLVQRPSFIRRSHPRINAQRGYPVNA